MSTQSKAEHLAAYIKALHGHDWAFEWSDDHRAFLAGRDSLEALRSAQKLIDPDHMIWNQIAPEGWKSTLTPAVAATGAPA